MIINKGFCTKICSDIELEGMLIIICYNDDTIAELNYEKGVDLIEIEISPNIGKHLFLLKDFQATLEKAEQLAIRCAREDEEFKKKRDGFMKNDKALLHVF